MLERKWEKLKEFLSILVFFLIRAREKKLIGKRFGNIILYFESLSPKEFDD